MAENFKDKGQSKGADDEARRELAKNWGHLTASMVSPDGGKDPPPLGGGKKRNGRGGAAPLPVSALPLPVEDNQAAAPRAEPPVDPSTLTPAQRARMGLDAVPAKEGLLPPSQSPSPARREAPAQPQPPAGPEPRLAPVANPVAPADRGAEPRVRTRTEVLKPVAAAPPPPKPRRESEETFEDVQRDRNVMSYGIAWTAFAIMVAMAIAFTRGMSGDPSNAAGPGPMGPALLSIGLGWVVVFIARGMGKAWWVMMILPAIVLMVGPFMYHNYWAKNVESQAHGYLAGFGADVLIDIDNTSIVSETVNTDRGCFAITIDRASKTSIVNVVMYTAGTARQAADYSLAPRFAGQVKPGGEVSPNRQFTFQNGQAPPIVTTPEIPPLDCEKSTSAPGTGAGTSDADEAVVE